MSTKLYWFRQNATQALIKQVVVKQSLGNYVIEVQIHRDNKQGKCSSLHMHILSFNYYNHEFKQV